MIIYKATNKINNKIYVGQTTKKLEERIKGHLKKSKSIISKAINKHGIENFTFEVIDYAINKDELDEKEIYWIKICNSLTPIGYNISNGGQGKSKICNDYVKELISLGLKNSEKWNKIKNSEEYKQKIREKYFNYNKGKKFSKEHSEKIWLANKERVLKYNKSTSKKWIMVDEFNNIIRLNSKEEFSKEKNICSGNLSKNNNKIKNNKIVKRYHGYYCFLDENQTDDEILFKVNELDSYYNSIFILKNRITNEVKKIIKKDLYKFCQDNNYDFSCFLKVTKGSLKSYRNWCLDS
jgi:group I intron endonuclease